MECMQVQHLIIPYIRGELDGQTLKEFVKHIESCEDCYQELEIYYAIQLTVLTPEEEQPKVLHLREMLTKRLELSKSYLNRRKIWGRVVGAILITAQILVVITLVVQIDIWASRNLESTTSYRAIMQRWNGYFPKEREETVEVQEIEVENMIETARVKELENGVEHE